MKEVIIFLSCFIFILNNLSTCLQSQKKCLTDLGVLRLSYVLPSSMLEYEALTGSLYLKIILTIRNVRFVK
jgi:hypothetical protein